ncbi:hypothetical protein [Sulfuriroseicoccus oceanibius]|uniref:Uncharacterized protein n=1 Tax=Sulfuriroseicoccus oceanibius TaxID=2707525 RepID=A0A6B3L6J9_9BACT|nr:hypothetical protein [Sulfuriroseicoccus oceanibius]QQL44069.1 hypothetical protein G3M56_009200 [Sulfuriroseicoccus oceanibius]
MKYSRLIPLFAICSFSSICTASEVAPTGLTVVVCDSSNKVLDTVVVPDDEKSGSVKFTLPEGVTEIRVFALGKRQHKDLPSGYFIKGRPDNDEWMGRGYVEAHVEKGLLVGIDGNGVGPIKFSEELEKQILADIKADKPAPLTTIKSDGEQDGAANRDNAGDCSQDL